MKSQEWQRAKKALETLYKGGCLSTQKIALKKSKPFSASVQTRICNIIRNPYIQKKFKIIEIIDNDNVITAVTLDRKNINFLETSNNSMDLYTSTLNQTVIINPTSIKSSFPSLNLEAAIGHELGHILRRHNLEGYCMKKAYKQRAQESPLSKQQFKKALYEFKKACETEADIIGTFNSLALAQEAHSNFLLLSAVQYSQEDLRVHPLCEERAAYMKVICQHMEAEQKAASIRSSIRQIAGLNSPSVSQIIKKFSTQRSKKTKIRPNRRKVLPRRSPAMANRIARKPTVGKRVKVFNARSKRPMLYRKKEFPRTKPIEVDRTKRRPVATPSKPSVSQLIKRFNAQPKKNSYNRKKAPPRKSSAMVDRIKRQLAATLNLQQYHQ